MKRQGARQIVLGFHSKLPVVMEVSAAQLSSDAGLLVVREFDERIGLTARFAAALKDTRDPVCTRQNLLSMVRQRIYGVLADYEDQNDHDELRSDPVFKLIADRRPDGPDLASQPTLSRFEPPVGGWICGDDSRSLAVAGRDRGAVPGRLRVAAVADHAGHRRLRPPKAD
jgi:hypothetical protein